MLYNYVLKHGYRFSAEIFNELYLLRKSLMDWNDIYVASIGCGPCTELFGAISQWRTMGKQDTSFHFRGFDVEAKWVPLMNKACSLFASTDASANNSNVFDYYQGSPERIDIIILNYMLSDIKKFHPELFDNFLANLFTLIKRKKPRFILINDVYLLNSVEASSRLLKYLRERGLDFLSAKYQYHHLHPYIGQYGKQVSKQPFAMSDSEIVRKYEPFSELNSIQTLLKLQ